MKRSSVAARGHLVGREVLGDPEVRELHRPRARHEHVPGLEVPMEDCPHVQELQTLRHLITPNNNVNKNKKCYCKGEIDSKSFHVKNILLKL